MTGQSPFPYFQDLQWIFQEVIGLIKETVSQPRSNHSTHSNVYEQLVHHFGAQPFGSQIAGKNDVTGKKSRSKKQSVPANAQLADVENLGIYIPGDGIKYHGRAWVY